MSKRILKYISIGLIFCMLFSTLVFNSFAAELPVTYVDKKGFHFSPTFFFKGLAYGLEYDPESPGYYTYTGENIILNDPQDDPEVQYYGYTVFELDQQWFQVTPVSNCVLYSGILNYGGNMVSRIPLVQNGTFDLQIDLLSLIMPNGNLFPQNVYVFCCSSSAWNTILSQMTEFNDWTWYTTLDSYCQAFESGNLDSSVYAAKKFTNPYGSGSLHWQHWDLTSPCKFPSDYDGYYDVHIVCISNMSYPGFEVMPGYVNFIPTGSTATAWEQAAYQDEVLQGIDEIEEQLSNINEGLFGPGQEVWTTNSDFENSVDDLIDAEEQLTQDLHGGIGGVINQEDVDAALEGHSNVFSFFSDALDRLCLQNSQIYGLIIYALILGIVVMLIGRRIYV